MLKFCCKLIFSCCLYFVIAYAYALPPQIYINGLNSNLEHQVLADLSLYHAIIKEPDLTPDRTYSLYKLSFKQISATLEALGYYNSHIDGHLKENIATFNINLGPPIIIKNINIQFIGAGANNQELIDTRKNLKIKPGEIINHKNYEETKTKLINKARQLGFLNAKFANSSIEISKIQKIANIILILDTGQQFKFGPVAFDSIYPDKLLMRYIPFKFNQDYSAKKISEFRQNLEGSDLFSEFQLESHHRDNDDLIVPIKVTTKAKPRKIYTGSLGYGDSTGARGTLGWTLRRVAHPGHKFNVNLSLSKVVKRFNINYSIPGNKPATDKTIFGALAKEQEQDERYSRRTEIHVTNIRQLKKIEQTLSISLFNEAFRISDNSSKEQKTYLLPRGKWYWQNVNELDSDVFGQSLEFSILGGSRYFLSATNIVKAEVKTKTIFPITNKIRLILKSQFGGLSTNDLELLPPSLRFYTGGDETVRGYSYNSLGPKRIDSSGKQVVIGGHYLINLSCELEKKIFLENLRAAVFIDAGNAFTELTPLAIGVGAGLRWSTPIGNFKIDLAKPLNQTSKKNIRLHLSFGTDFKKT